jgi:ABC-2 type transport system permease protein
MRSKSNLPAYLQIVSLLTQTAFAYRVELVVELAGLLLKVFLLRVVWTAVYAGRTEVDGVPLEEVIGFMTLANLQLFLMASWIAGYLYDRIRQGLIALDLARPVPFMGQLMAYQVGGTVALLPFLLVAAPLAFLVGGLQLPASPIAAALYLVSLLLAYLVSTLIAMLIGLVAFWTTEIWGIRTIVDFVSQFFSGALVPLWFFPPLLREVAGWLPFQAQAYLPLTIYLGRTTGLAALGLLGLQLFWVLLLGGCVALVWRRAMRRVVVQGG